MDHLDPDTLAALRRRLAEGASDAARAALRRLEEGRYGLCAACGEAIPGEALRDRPEQGQCAGCLDALAVERRARRFGVCGVKPR